MQDVFNLQARSFDNVIMLKSEYEEGRCGTVVIYLCRKLQLTKYGQELICKITEGSLAYEGAQEPVDWDDSQRKVDPWRREEPNTCLLRGFGALDIISISNGSCFLSLKEVYQSPDTVVIVKSIGKGFILQDDGDLKDCLDVVLPKIGVPKTDVQKVGLEILSKLNF